MHQTLDQIKMPVFGKNLVAMLKSDRRDPHIICWYGRPGVLEGIEYRCVKVSGFNIDCMDHNPGRIQEEIQLFPVFYFPVTPLESRIKLSHAYR